MNASLQLSKLYLCALTFAVAGVIAVPAHATAYAVDQGTLWFSTGNLGWGVQLTSKSSNVFATLYVYDDDGNTANWYVATLTPQAVQSVWAGDLFALSGPWLGPTPVSLDGLGLRKVGTMRWQDAGYAAQPGTLTYTVEGESTSEQILRGSGNVVDEYSGRYVAARSWTDSCGGSFEDAVELSIAQSPPAIDISWHDTAAGIDCKIAGNLKQRLTYASVAGTYSCGAATGKVQLSDMLVLAEKLTARWSTESSDGQCRVEGELTAVRRR